MRYGNNIDEVVEVLGATESTQLNIDKKENKRSRSSNIEYEKSNEHFNIKSVDKKKARWCSMVSSC